MTTTMRRGTAYDYTTSMPAGVQLHAMNSGETYSGGFFDWWGATTVQSDTIPFSGGIAQIGLIIESNSWSPVGPVSTPGADWLWVDDVVQETQFTGGSPNGWWVRWRRNEPYREVLTKRKVSLTGQSLWLAWDTNDSAASIPDPLPMYCSAVSRIYTAP